MPRKVWGPVLIVHIVLIISLALTSLFLIVGNALALDTSNCIDCHGGVVNGFTLDPVDRNNCYTCHQQTEHYNNGATVLTPYGYFQTADSPLAPPPTVHGGPSGTIHVDDGFANIYCQRCHATASCKACHSTVAHGQHSSTAAQPVTQVTTLGGYYNFPSEEAFYCGTSMCHTTLPDVVRQTPDGKILCLNCHAVDQTGHGDLTAKHQSTTDLTSSVNVINCSWCHSSTEAEYATNNLIGVHVEPNITLSRVYDCYVCHSSTSPVRAQIDNKQTACDACHNDTSAPAAHPDSQYYPRHAVSRFPTFMPEYSPNCGTCHAGNSVISLHTAVNVGCKTCHYTEPYKPAVVSLNADCSGCHSASVNSAMDMAESHKAFHNANTTVYPETAECLKCHARDATADGQNLLAVHKKDSTSAVTCDTCHGATARQAVKDAVATNNVSCQACHSYASHNHPVAEDGYALQAPVECGRCHGTNTGDQGAELATVHQQAAERGLIPNYGCNTCHNSTFEGADKVIVKDGSLDMKQNGTTVIYCDACHNGTLVQTKEVGHKPEHLAKHSATNMDCSGCHGFSAAAGVATDIKSAAIHKDCNTCHGSATRNDVKFFISSRVRLDNPVYNCEDCHGTIHVDWEDKHRPTFPVDPTMTCADCHNNYLPAEHTRYFGTGETNVGYKVYRSDDGGQNYAHVGSTLGTSYSSGGLKPSTTYYYKVQAYDLAGNHSGFSNIASATTPAPPPATVTLNPADAQYGEGIDADVKADANIKSLSPSALTRLTDGKDSKGGSNDVTVREYGSSDKWIYVKINYDAKNYSSIKLMVRASWKDSIATGDFWIYPYKSDGANIDTNSRVTYNISKPTYNGTYTNYTIDVTSAAHEMDGYGWIKFRVKPGSYSKGKDVWVSEVRIILDNPSTSEPSTTTPDGTLTIVSSNDTTPPTAPGNLKATAVNSAQIDLTWTASTDEGPTAGEGNTCVLCHGSSVRANVKAAVGNHDANCGACHTIHGDIPTAHTGPALPTTPWDCARCHTNVLSTEHSASAILQNNAWLDCNTCHKSTLAKVTAAIDSTVTDRSNLVCGSCHTGTVDGAPQVHSDIAAPHLSGIFPTATDNVCLNCHTTQAKEFSATNEGYHAVNGLTPKTSGIGGYISGWTATSPMSCQDCHGSNGTSPTTAYANILKKPFSATTSNLNPNDLCFLCHDWGTYGGGSRTFSTGFKDKSGKNLHNDSHHIYKSGTTDPDKQVYCVSCHTYAPHGGKYRMLGTTKDTDAPFQSYAKNIRIDRVTTYEVQDCATNCGKHPTY